MWHKCFFWLVCTFETFIRTYVTYLSYSCFRCQMSTGGARWLPQTALMSNVYLLCFIWQSDNRMNSDDFSASSVASEFLSCRAKRWLKRGGVGVPAVPASHWNLRYSPDLLLRRRSASQHNDPNIMKRRRPVGPPLHTQNTFNGANCEFLKFGRSRKILWVLKRMIRLRKVHL